jgi:hypothetical protein
MRKGERLTCLAALSLAGCGYVGDPLPPSLKIPQPVADLAAVQRGDRIIIQFTAPEMTTDGLPLTKLREVDLRIGAEGVQPWHRESWEAGAARLPAGPEAAGSRVRIESPAASWAGREVILAVRVAGPSGRWSDWSDFRALHIVHPLPAPSGVAALNVPEGVKLSWQWADDRPGIRFRVFRRGAGQQAVSLAAEIEQREWTDAQAGYDETYEYLVQAVLAAGDDIAESDLSPPVSITPEDRFPPAVPAGLAAVAALETIELSWERVADEPSLTYRVYRSEVGGEMARIADALTVPGYSDREAVSGKRYTYAVSAVDGLGNESEKSPPVEAGLP